MSTNHIVRQGDCLSSIATQYGFTDYNTIYQHPRNARLRKDRPDPNVLLPGDQVFIPDPQQRIVNKGDAATHKFRVLRLKTFLELVLQLNEQPIANAAYTLRFDSRTVTGTTDGAGKLKEPIAPDEAQAVLSMKDPALEWTLSLGQLDPASALAGAQERLDNLGFACGDADGITGPRTRAALRQYQAMRKLNVTGVDDAATIAKLKKEHDNT